MPDADVGPVREGSQRLLVHTASRHSCKGFWLASLKDWLAGGSGYLFGEHELFVADTAQAVFLALVHDGPPLPQRTRSRLSTRTGDGTEGFGRPTRDTNAICLKSLSNPDTIMSQAR